MVTLCGCMVNFNECRINASRRAARVCGLLQHYMRPCSLVCTEHLKAKSPVSFLPPHSAAVNVCPSARQHSMVCWSPLEIHGGCLSHVFGPCLNHSNCRWLHANFSLHTGPRCLRHFRRHKIRGPWRLSHTGQEPLVECRPLQPSFQQPMRLLLSAGTHHGLRQ